MNLPLYNREGALGNTGWIHIVPRGELPNAEAGVVQVLDDRSLDSILARFEADKQRKGANWPGLYIGVEHHIYDPDQSSEAMGWAKSFRKEADGIWALPEWTDIGEEAVKNRRFKYTSFTADPRDIERLDGDRVRILAVETVGLTNLPNGKDLLKPIANREGLLNRAASARASALVQNRAAERVAHLAEQEMRLTGRSQLSCWSAVMNREPALTALARGTPSAALTAGARGARQVMPDAADYASQELLRRAQNRKGPGFYANLVVVQNRFPRLAKLANREAAWDCLNDLVPQAHEAFLGMVNQPREDALPGWRWTDFLSLVDVVAAEFPGLSDEDKWQKVKELYPASFLQFVLSFEVEDNAEEMAMEQQLQDKNQRKLVSMAAGDERQRARIDGYRRLPGMKQAAVQGAMRNV